MNLSSTWRSVLDSLFGASGERFSARQVGEYYNRWTDRYEEGFGHTFQSNRTENISDLLAHIAVEAEFASGQRVLDAGCGVGGPAVWFAREYGVRVDALTNSSVQVHKARDRVENAGLDEEVRVIEGDFHHLEDYFPYESYDAVIFLESLVHAHCPRRVLQSVARVLRPGGVLYVKDLFQLQENPGGREGRRIRNVIENTNRYFRLKVQRVETIEKAMQNAGLRLGYCRELPLATQHDLGNAFCHRHGLDIYEGEPVTYLDWLEMKAKKEC